MSLVAAQPRTLPSTLAQTQKLDVAIRVAHPLQYLETLAHIVVNQFSGSAIETSLLPLLAADIGYLPERLSEAQRAQVNFDVLPQVVGWFHHRRLEQMLHREWLAGATNEFSAHIPALARMQCLRTARKVNVAGAGVCRLAAYLREINRSCEVICADLSYLALYFGKLMLENRSRELPSLFFSPRRVYEVAAPDRLVARELPTTYEPAAESGGRHSFEVRNICDSQAISSDTDLICAMYLLDAASQPTPMLVRMCEQMEVGQELMLVSSPSATRDPADLLATLQACGLVPQQVELAWLPYSFTRHDATYTEMRSQTLLVHARKLDNGSLRAVAIAPTAPIERIQAARTATVLPGQRHGLAALSSTEVSALKAGMRCGNYQDFRSSVDAELGSARCNELVTWLITHDFLQLGLR